MRQNRNTRNQRNQFANISAAKMARLQFADWLEKQFPPVFQIAAEQASAHASAQAALFEQKKAQLGELGIDWGDIWSAPETVTKTTEATQSTWSKFIDGAIAAGTAYLTLENQKDILALNIERAKAGQPPIDAATTAPIIRTQVDIDPELAKSLMADAGGTITRNMMIIAAVGLAAILFLGRK
jgi:hypothetical protein